MTPRTILALFTPLALAGALLAQESPAGPDEGDSSSLPGITRVLVRSEKLAPGAKFWVRNRNGDIRVMGWDKEEMHLTAEIRDTDRRRVDLQIWPKEGGLDVETRFQQPLWSFDWGVVQSPRCEMTIFVPRRLAAYFQTTNGSVHVSYVDGYARCETNNGDIEVEEIRGEVMAVTKNGGIEGRDLEARIKATTVNGQVNLVNITGGISAETTNGNLSARDLNGWGEGISLTTTNGSIDLSLGDATGEITAESTDGSLDIRVPDIKILEKSKRAARFRVPGRSQKIVLRTTNGTITIRE